MSQSRLRFRNTTKQILTKTTLTLKSLFIQPSSSATQSSTTLPLSSSGKVPSGIIIIRKRGFFILLLLLCLLVYYVNRDIPQNSVGKANMRWSIWLYSLIYIPGRKYTEDFEEKDIPLPHYPLHNSVNYPIVSSSITIPSTSVILFPQRWKGVLHNSHNAYCEQLYGNTWLREFIDSRQLSCIPPSTTLPISSVTTVPYSTIASYEAVHGARLYWMKNILIDFQRLQRTGKQREFLPGFIQGNCEPSLYPLFLGGGHDEPALSSTTWKNLYEDTSTKQSIECDIWEDRPTIIIQHDNIFNHYQILADIWRVWIAAVIITDDYICLPNTDKESLDSSPTIDISNNKDSVINCPSGTHVSYGVKPEDIQILTLDSEIMCNKLLEDNVTPDRSKDIEDCLTSLYISQYTTWFPKYGIKRPQQYFSSDYNKPSKNVCFKSVTFAASLPYHQIWEGWLKDTGCEQQSAIMTQFLDFTLKQWNIRQIVPWNNPVKNENNNNNTDPNLNNQPYIRIGYIKYPSNTNYPRDPQQQYPLIANEVEFIYTVTETAKKAFDNGILHYNHHHKKNNIQQVNVDFIPIDITTLSYGQQIETIRSMHILIGMHHPDMVHGIYMSKTDICGGKTTVIELFNIFSKHIKGIQHIISMTGHLYSRWANYDPLREIENKGTIIDTKEIEILIREAVRNNIEERQC